jgi:hypothetical protein
MEVYNQTLALSSLPAQPLIHVELVDAVFVTLWLVATIALSITLGSFVSKKRKSPTWSEFKTILTGTQTLAV